MKKKGYEIRYERDTELFHSYKIQKEARETICFRNVYIGARPRKTNKEIIATITHWLITWLGGGCC